MRRQSDTLRPGDRAPDFALEDASGRVRTLDGLLAGACLLLVFDRGTWWPNCRRRFGELQRNRADYEVRGGTLAVILAQRRERVRQFVADHGLAFPVLVDAQRQTARAYGVWHRLGLDAINIARPALFVIDPDKTVRTIYVAESQGEFPTHADIINALESGI